MCILIFSQSLIKLDDLCSVVPFLLEEFLSSFLSFLLDYGQIMWVFAAKIFESSAVTPIIILFSCIIIS